MRLLHQDSCVCDARSPQWFHRASSRVLLLGLLIFSLLAAPAWAEQKVRVGVYQNSPKVSLSSDGKPEGIFVDVIEAIARNEGWQLEYVAGTWTEGLARLDAGEIDLMPDMARTTERERLYAFHQEPVLASWNQVYTRRGSGIRSLLDLETKHVAVLEGSVQQNLFKQMAAGYDLSSKLVPYPDYDAAFQAVARGQADAVITNRFFGVRNAGKYGLEDTAIIFSPSKLYFAAPRTGHGAQLAAIDKHLLEFKKDSGSVYYRSLRRWAVDEVRAATPAWLAPAALVALALLLAGVAWVALLKRQVASKTREIHRRSEEVLVINRTLRATGSRRELDSVLAEAVKGALALTGFDGGVLCIRDEQGALLRVGARIGAVTETDRAADGSALGDAVCPAMLESVAKGKRHALLAANAPGVAPCCGNVSDATVRWNAYFPLEVQGRTIGILCLFSRKVEPPPVHAMELVEDICGPVALAMENARLYQEAREDAQELEQRVEMRTREIAQLTAFLRAIIDHIANPIFYKDPDLRFLGCNRAYEQAFGIKRADIVGKSVLEVAYLPQADRRIYQDEQMRALATGTTVHREATMPFADGKMHPTLYSAQSFQLPDGSPGGLVGAIVDITQLKDAESALRAANAEQNAIFEAANFGIALIQNQLIQRCNRRLEAIFGYAPGEFRNQPTRIWYRSDDEYEHASERVYAEIAGGGTHRREQQLKRLDGSVFWCRLMARALDPSDPARGIVEVIEDVSDERAAAEALLDAKLRAESADRIKSAFLATMSHELRTPLNSIIGFTGIVLQGLAGPLNDEQGKQLGMVRDSARHLLALINDVLDISKIEAGEFAVGCEPFDLSRSIEKVVGIVRPLAEKKGLTLAAHVAQGVGPMLSDARRIEQVLLNLLGNAIKFSETGSVTLQAEAVSNFRSDAGQAPTDGVRISVTDTGMGIKPEDMVLLFTPFRQIDSQLSRKHEGTGLGLAICRRLITLMGGDIEARSEWGKGSVFTMTLPLQASPVLEAQ